VVEYTCPVISAIPGYLAGGVYLNGHDLADAAALDDDDEGANTAVMATPLFAALDVGDNEGVPNICPGNGVCRSDRETTV